MNVLLVEDDADVGDAAEIGLTRFGFSVTLVGTAQQALDGAADADVIILDLGLPDLDGFEVCRRLRRLSSVPIIVLSGRGDEMDRVLALEIGADDYVVKPVGFHELVARIRAISRRGRLEPSDTHDHDNNVDDRRIVDVDPAPESPTPRIGSLRIDPSTRRATVADVELSLSAKEFDLLHLLAATPGAVVHRDLIIERVWGGDYVGSTKTLDTHVSVLRRKLGHPGWIEAVRRVGFRLVPQE